MIGRDKVQLRSKIQLRHLAIAALIVTCITATIVLYFNKSNSYYEVLSNEVLGIINEANQRTPIEITPTNGTVPPVTINDTASLRVIFYSETKHRLSIEYYSNKKLRAISYLEESEKLLRRELFDLEGRIRIKCYYNSDGDLVQKEYYDENNRRVSQIYLPATIRPGY
jgi:hypothetical protein